MKVTLDTNILISSTFWDGDSNKILNKVENNKIELILSEELIKEFTKVLNYEEIKNKIRDKSLEMNRTVEKIISLSKIVAPLTKFDIVSEDHDDNKIIECAVEGNVNYIITNDNHLLKLKEFQEIKIITPVEFLKIISKQ